MGQSQSTNGRPSDRSPRNEDSGAVVGGGTILNETRRSMSSSPSRPVDDAKTTGTSGLDSDSNSGQPVSQTTTTTMTSSSTPPTSTSSTPIPRMNKGARTIRKLLNRQSWIPKSRSSPSPPNGEPSPKARDIVAVSSGSGTLIDNGNKAEEIVSSLKVAPDAAGTLSAKDSIGDDAPSAVSAPFSTQPLLASGSRSNSQPIALQDTSSPEISQSPMDVSLDDAPEPPTTISLSDPPFDSEDQTLTIQEDSSSSSPNIHLTLPASPVRVPSTSSSKSKRQELAGDHLAQERAAIRRRIATLKGSPNDEPYPTIVASSSTPTTPTSPTSPLDSSSSESETVVHLEPDPAFIQPPFVTHSTPPVSPSRRSFHSPMPSPFDMDRSFVMAEEEVIDMGIPLPGDRPRAYEHNTVESRYEPRYSRYDDDLELDRGLGPPSPTSSRPPYRPLAPDFREGEGPEELLQRLVAALERSDLENRVRAVAAERAVERERAAHMLASAAAGSASPTGFGFGPGIGSGSEIGNGSQIDPGSIASSLQSQRMRISGAHRNNYYQHHHPARSPGYGYPRPYGYGTSSSSSFSAPSTPATPGMPTSTSSTGGGAQQGASSTTNQHQAVPSLPVIPAGTTMIVQGVVQTAEAPPPAYRSVYEDDDNVASRANRSSTFLSPAPAGRDRRSNLFSRRWLSGTPTGQEERTNGTTETANGLDGGADGNGNRGGSGNGLASNLTPGADTPTGAAELLGALLIAAASATANMLLSDPPTENANGGATQNMSTNPPRSFTSPPEPLASSTSQSASLSSTTAVPSTSITSAPTAAERSTTSSTTPATGSTPRTSDSTMSRMPRQRPQSLIVPPTSAFEDSDDEEHEFGSVRPRPGRGRDRPVAPRPRSLIGAVRDRLFGSFGDEPSEPRPPRRRGARLQRAQPVPPPEAPATTSANDPIEIPTSTPTPPTDPVEALRQRIANELRRALANRDGMPGSMGMDSSSSPTSLSGAPLPGHASPAPTAATSGHENQTVMPSLEALLGSQAAATANAFGGADRPLPLEGTFDRFLHDTSVDLRTTLLERMNRNRNIAIPIPIPAPAPGESSANNNEGSSQPTSTSTGDDATATNSSSAAPNQPVQVVYRSPDGIIEPRLNWWRMYRFPPRLVANTPSTMGPGAGMGSSAFGGGRVGSGLPSNPTMGGASNNPGSSTLIPVIVVGIRTAPTVLVQDIAALTSAPPSTATTTAPPTTFPLTPASASTPTPARARRFSRPLSALMGSASSSGRNSPDPVASGSTNLTSEAEAAIGELLNPLSEALRASNATGASSSSTPATPALGATRTRPWARAVNALARSVTGGGSTSSTPPRQETESIAARIEREQARLRQNIAELEATLDRRERDTAVFARGIDDFGTGDSQTAVAADGQPRDRMRNYLIWVIGGYYPESHPILTSPNLLLNQFDQEDFWGLAELLGQVKPPVATKDDIERAGLEVIKTEQLKTYEEEKKVTSNTTERCLICLGDYEPDEDLRIMACKHVFHQPCVDRWLEEGRNNCPACRTKGVDVDTSSASSSSMDHGTTTAPNALSSSSA